MTTIADFEKKLAQTQEKIHDNCSQLSLKKIDTVKGPYAVFEDHEYKKKVASFNISMVVRDNGLRMTSSKMIVKDDEGKEIFHISQSYSSPEESWGQENYRTSLNIHKDYDSVDQDQLFKVFPIQKILNALNDSVDEKLQEGQKLSVLDKLQSIRKESLSNNDKNTLKIN